MPHDPSLGHVLRHDPGALDGWGLDPDSIRAAVGTLADVAPLPAARRLAALLDETADAAGPTGRDLSDVDWAHDPIDLPVVAGAVPEVGYDEASVVGNAWGLDDTAGAAEDEWATASGVVDEPSWHGDDGDEAAVVPPVGPSDDLAMVDFGADLDDVTDDAFDLSGHDEAIGDVDDLDDATWS